MLGGALADLGGAPRRRVELDAVAAVALDEPLDPQEEIGPHRLRAEIAAPDAAEQRVRQEQRERGENEQAGEVIDFLRPDFDEEEVEARVREIDQHRLMRLVRPAIPAHERQEVVDAEADEQQAPLQAAKRPADLLRIDFRRRGVEGTLVVNLVDPLGLSSPTALTARAQAVHEHRQRLDASPDRARAPCRHRAVAGEGNRSGSGP